LAIAYGSDLVNKTQDWFGGQNQPNQS